MFSQPKIQPFTLPLDAPISDPAEVFFNLPEEPPETWQPEAAEGRLAVDVVETDSELIITAPMAGTRPEDISLHLHNDVLTIRGTREPPFPPVAEEHHRECYWGAFSRTIVLPAEVKGELAQSEYRHGLLTIRLPKAIVTDTIPILLVEE